MLRISTLSVSPICLGGNVFGWTANQAASEQILDAFVAGGGNFVDTADSYSAWVPGHTGGESERVIGGWLRKRGKHDDLVIATKVAKLPGHRGLRPANLQVCLDGSRRRLGVRTIDLYYAHQDDPQVPTAEWLGAFDAMIKAGDIRHYGLSNFSAERVREVVETATANGLALPVALQPEYNLLHRRDVEGGLTQAAQEFGMTIVSYFALAAGFLTGKYARDEPVRGARAGHVKPYLTDDGFNVVDAVVDVADAAGVEPASVALAWVRAQGCVPIASASAPEQVEALLSASTLKLARPQLTKLTKASAPFA